VAHPGQAGEEPSRSFSPAVAHSGAAVHGGDGAVCRFAVPISESAEIEAGQAPAAPGVPGGRKCRARLIAVVPQKASSTEEWLKLVGEQRTIEHRQTDLESTE
jgi:hypothetical protein